MISLRTTLAAIVPALAAAVSMGFSSCSQESAAAIYPAADMRPPALLEAGPSDSRSLRLRFDEAVAAVQGSFSVEPRAELSCRAEDCELLVAFATSQSPGADYILAGEVDDLRGNRTRFLLRFTGWNDRPPRLRLSEVQTGKNTAITRPHRDYVEFEVLSDGNVGGEELAWTSSVKSSTYRFPAIEVRKGEYLVLHLAPEGIAEERDELEADLSASGGIDATAAGRDLWCPLLPLPDESGALSLSLRPGAPPIDGLFYGGLDRTGPLSSDRLAELVSRLSAAGLWPLAGAQAAWEDAYRWKSTAARSICRRGEALGPGAWYTTAAGAQSPGGPNAGPEMGVGAAAKSLAKKLSRKVSVKKG